MSIEIIKNMAEEMARTELNLANKQHPYFASNHEGWAVIIEEYFETLKEFEECKEMVSAIQACVFDDSPQEACAYALRLKQNATFLSCEAIQLAAMAQKFIDSDKNRKDNNETHTVASD